MLNRAEDERGVFQELYKDKAGIPHFCPTSKIFICQISKLTINPGQTRGNHYHKDTVEMFLMESGSATFTLKWVNTNPIQTYDFNLTAGNENSHSIIVHPNINHIVTSKDGCEIIIFSSRVFDPQNPDTYRLDDER